MVGNGRKTVGRKPIIHSLEVSAPTVFLADLSAFPDMDAAWAAWVPEGAEPSRATVGANLLPGMKIEIKVTAAEP